MGCWGGCNPPPSQTGASASFLFISLGVILLFLPGSIPTPSSLRRTGPVGPLGLWSSWGVFLLYPTPPSAPVQKPGGPRRPLEPALLGPSPQTPPAADPLPRQPWPRVPSPPPSPTYLSCCPTAPVLTLGRGGEVSRSLDLALKDLWPPPRGGVAAPSALPLGSSGPLLGPLGVCPPERGKCAPSYSSHRKRGPPPAPPRPVAPSWPGNPESGWGEIQGKQELPAFPCACGRRGGTAREKTG